MDYIAAPPRMALYMERSTQIYSIYLKYIAPEDLFAYSIDEVFMDVTNYLETYHLTARELAMKIILDVLETTGITATAGIGTNLYLAKVAMDIGAKHIPADKNGVRIAELDEMSYRRSLWTHRPLTDFWRVGKGYARKLEAHGMYTMGDVARCSLTNEDLLYRLFGVNAELLIDHAWGWEPVTMADIKAYQPESKSIGSGQVLQCPYSYDKARLVVREMADQLSLELVDKGLVADQLVRFPNTPTVPPIWRGIRRPRNASSPPCWSSSTASSTKICRCAASPLRPHGWCPNDPPRTRRTLSKWTCSQTTALFKRKKPVSPPHWSGRSGCSGPCWTSRGASARTPSSRA